METTTPVPNCLTKMKTACFVEGALTLIKMGPYTPGIHVSTERGVVIRRPGARNLLTNGTRTKNREYRHPSRQNIVVPFDALAVRGMVGVLLILAVSSGGRRSAVSKLRCSTRDCSMLHANGLCTSFATHWLWNSSLTRHRHGNGNASRWNQIHLLVALRYWVHS